MQKIALSAILAVWISAIGAAFVGLFAPGCLIAKQVGRTLNEVARALCETIAADQDAEARQGMTAKDWCAIQRNLDPFLDIVLAAKQEKVGFKK